MDKVRVSLVQFRRQSRRNQLFDVMHGLLMLVGLTVFGGFTAYHWIIQPWRSGQPDFFHATWAWLIG